MSWIRYDGLYTTISRCYRILMPCSCHSDSMRSLHLLEHGFILVPGEPSKWVHVGSFVFEDPLIDLSVPEEECVPHCSCRDA